MLISVPDLEDYVNNGNGTEKYTLEVLIDLYYLLSNNISTDDRMEFYRDTSIIKEGMESSITVLEYADKLKHQAEEQVQRAEEICVKTWCEFGKQSGWSKAQIIQKVVELLRQIIVIYDQCAQHEVPFRFFGMGDVFVKDGKERVSCL